MVVNEILAEAKNVIGKCDEATVFRRITDAVRLANNQGKFDIALGVMDICVCNGCLTLPADVGTILGVNNGGFPTLIRDQWFEYHANGMGSQCFTPWNYTDELGRVTTFRDPSGPVKLVAVVESALDSNIPLRVFGWDENGKRIYTANPEGILEDGMVVPTVFGYPVPNPAAPTIAKIDRVQKPITNGFINLIAVDSTTLESQTAIGYYLPWETNPYYRRIKVPNQSWVRIKYRKRDLEVRSSVDWINIDNREALLMLIKAVKYRLDNQLELARGFEIEGIRLLSNEAEALRPTAISPPQIIWNEGIPAGPTDRMFY